jgi:zinc protease
MLARLLVLVALASCGPAKGPAPAKLPDLAPPPHKIEAPPLDPLAVDTPLDPQIKLGHLKNGLTYYVMKHQKPEQRASLWLAVNAGSVLEDDDQRGLAHFCEHMAFNGTKRFPKQDIVNYIEKVGMEFGADVNAYTAFDQTVYQLTVPTDDHDVLMKGLDILRDWAGDVSYDPVEVDKERGVVLEEWRLGRGAFARVQDKQWPVMFAGSRYADRLVIGKPEILKTAKRDTLYRFYKDWYRPDNMAVIVVGDFDPAAIEKEIQTRFGDLVNPAKERTRDAIAVPHDQPTAVTIATDPELPFTSVAVYDKLDHRPEMTKGDYRRYLVEGLYHSMLGARFEELGLDPKAPFLNASSSTTSWVRNADLFVREGQAKAGHVADTLTAVLHEVERVEKYGFVATELERARRRILSNAETSAKEWDKTPDPDIADEITRHFFEHEQMGGRALELAYTQEMLPTITLDELNHLAKSWGSDKGRVIALSGPTTEKMPSEAEVKKLFTDAEAAPVEAWTDVGGDRQLMPKKPTPGKVTATAHDAVVDATVWTLSNGIRVIVKPTTFQNDEVQFEGWQLGGTSLLSDTDYSQVRFGGLVTAMGVGDLDPITLEKVLSGKVASAGAGYGELAESVSGSARPADLETALQLAYLRVTAPRKDERAFAAWKQEQLEWVRHRKLLPEVNFFDEMSAVQSGNHFRRQPTTEAMLAKIDVDKALAVYKSRFVDFGGFTFVFIGNIDVAKLQPLVEMYLGSLPSAGKKEHWKDIGIKYPTQTVTKTVLAGTEPKSFVSLMMTAPDKWSMDLERDARILSMVLEIRFREVLREDMGGVYSVSVNASLSREPTQRRYFSVFFGCDPANVDKLKQAVFDEVGKIATAGIGDEYLAKVKEQLRRQHETDIKENSWWMQQIHDAYYYGDDFAKQIDIAAISARVTSDNVKAAAKHFFDAKHFVFGVLRPKATSAQPAPPAKPPTPPSP